MVVEEVVVGTGMSFRDPAPAIDDESRITWFVSEGFNIPASSETERGELQNLRKLSFLALFIASL